MTVVRLLTLYEWLRSKGCDMAQEAAAWVGRRTVTEAWEACNRPGWLAQFAVTVGRADVAARALQEAGEAWVLAAASRHPDHTALADLSYLVRLAHYGEREALAKNYEDAVRAQYVAYWCRKGDYNPVFVWSAAARILAAPAAEWVLPVTVEYLTELAHEVGEGDVFAELYGKAARALADGPAMQAAWEAHLAKQYRRSHHGSRRLRPWPWDLPPMAPNPDA